LVHATSVDRPNPQTPDQPHAPPTTARMRSLYGGSMDGERLAGARSVLVLLAGACAAGLALGALTAYGQEWLPPELGSLANSSGSWCLVAFGLALIAGSPRIAALCGALTLGTLLAGYVLGASTRGDPSSSSLILFWGAAAILLGPLIGLAAHAVRYGPATWAALGTGAMSGLLIGEGIYGLTYIADTTYPPYWWGELIVGLGLLGWIAKRRFPRLRPIALAAGIGLVVAAAFIAVYSQDLIALLG